MQMRKYKWIAMPFLVFATVILLFRFVFLIGYVPSGSMEPTLKENSYILGVRIVENLDIGDIIVFKHDGQTMVKRIAGKGGDKVQTIYGEMIVPEGQYYVLGDNAANSYDSRYWINSFIKREDVIAKLLFKK